MRKVGTRTRFFDTTRGQIILYLMESPHTVSELAEKLDLTDNAVRAHLVALERDGVVRQEGERRSGGRPAYVYQVTPEADELFPKAYDRALVQLLDVLADRMDEAELEDVLLEAGRRSVQTPSPDASFEQLVQKAEEVIEGYGGLPETELSDDGTVRIESKSCPLSSVVQEHPTTCLMARGALEKILGSDVEMECEVAERPRCAFEARVKAKATA